MKVRIILGIIITILFGSFIIYNYLKVKKNVEVVVFTNDSLPAYNLYMNSLNKKEIIIKNNYAINSGTLVDNLVIDGDFNKIHFNTKVGFTVKQTLKLKNLIINLGNMIEFSNTGSISINNSIIYVNNNSLLITGKKLVIKNSIIIGTRKSKNPLVDFRSESVEIRDTIFIDQSKHRTRGSLFLRSKINMKNNIFVSHLYKLNAPVVFDNVTGKFIDNIIIDLNPYNRAEFVGRQLDSGEYEDQPDLIEGRIGILSFEQNLKVENNTIVGENKAYCPMIYSNCFDENILVNNIELKSLIKKQVHHSLLPHINNLILSL